MKHLWPRYVPLRYLVLRAAFPIVYHRSCRLAMPPMGLQTQSLAKAIQCRAADRAVAERLNKVRFIHH